jgi:hypothetical protein
MIRAAVPAKGGGLIVLLGITPRNVEKLKDGDPMYLDLAELGAPGVKLTIIYGQTERAIMAELRAAGLELPAAAEDDIRAVEAEHRRRGTTP